MTAPLYLWARVGQGAWAAVSPGRLWFTCPKDAELVAARYRLAYPNLNFQPGEVPPIGGNDGTH